MNNRVKIEAIVACSSKDKAIGKKNTLPFRLPKDMARFKSLTSGHAVVMGRKTAESIPFALPNRTNYVMTKTGKVPYEEQIPVRSIQEVVNWELANKEKTTIFVIGGEKIYRHMLPYLTGLHLTTFDKTIEEADAFWPADDFQLLFPKERQHQTNHTLMEVDNGTCTYYTHYNLDPIPGPPLLSIRPLTTSTSEV